LAKAIRYRIARWRALQGNAAGNIELVPEKKDFRFQLTAARGTRLTINITSKWHNANIGGNMR
jgi:hypothetical protein